MRAFELDVHLDAAGGALHVYHLSLIDDGTTCRSPRECLLVLRRWSDAHPGHLPLFVQIEPKSGFAGDIPSGAPARCNPLTSAATACTPFALENPLGLRAC